MDQFKIINYIHNTEEELNYKILWMDIMKNMWVTGS